MRAFCLGSSSSGNCFVFDFGEGTEPLMVECGLQWGEALRRATLEPNCPSLCKITRCLITHAHNDHCVAWRSLDERGIDIYASAQTIGILKCEDGKALEMLKPNDIGGGLWVLPFQVNHDILGACGFVIKSAKETIVFINDSTGWTDDLRNFKPDCVFIECNYWERQAGAVYSQNKKLLKTEPPSGKAYHEAEIENKQLDRDMASHMSLAGCEKWLGKLNLLSCKAIFLMHLSQRYANEFKMKEEIKKAYNIQVYVCQKLGGIK